MVGWIAGWVDDSFRKYCHFLAPSCKLELARFLALLRIQDGAECGYIVRHWSVFRIRVTVAFYSSSLKTAVRLLLFSLKYLSCFISHFFKNVLPQYWSQLSGQFPYIFTTSTFSTFCCICFRQILTILKIFKLVELSN